MDGIREMVETAKRALTRGAWAAVAVIGLATAACEVSIYDSDDRDLEILWPRSGARLSGEEVLRVRLRGYDLDEYDVYWYVDDSEPRRMANDRGARPRQKVSVAETWSWDWNGNGPYTVGFIAENRRGYEIAHRTVRVYVR